MRHILIISLIASTWVVLALAAMLPGSIATAAVPNATPIPPGVTVIGTAPGMLIVRGETPDYVNDLYRAGAKFVLPARQKTCLTLQG